MTSNSASTVECTSFPDHPNDCNTINIIRRVFGALSCIGCIFVIFIIWVFNRYTSFSQRLILYLSIAALLNSIGRLFQDSTSEHGGWCSFQALWLTYFNWTIMLWVGCITLNLYMNVIWFKTTDRLERWYHVVCWAGSFAISLLPFINNHYGPSGSWCWITKDLGWRLAMWYVPLFIFIVINSAVYIFIIFRLHKEASAWTGAYDPENERKQQTLKEDIKPLRLYPFVYLVLSIFPLINRIQNASSERHVFALVLLHAISATLQGAAYALVFAIDRQTLSSLTSAQIKAALQSKWAPPIVVKEYEADVPPALTTVENPMATASDTPPAAAAYENVAHVSDIDFTMPDMPIKQSKNSVLVLDKDKTQVGSEETEDSSTA